MGISKNSGIVFRRFLISKTDNVFFDKFYIVIYIDVYFLLMESMPDSTYNTNHGAILTSYAEGVDFRYILRQTKLKDKDINNRYKHCRRTESNCRHKDFQSFALPTELQRQKQWNIYIKFSHTCQVLNHIFFITQ